MEILVSKLLNFCEIDVLIVTVCTRRSRSALQCTSRCVVTCRNNEQQCSPKVDEVCNTVDVQECSTVYEQVCSEHQDRHCSTSHEQQCTTVEEEECKTDYEQKCEVVYVYEGSEQ